MPSGKQKKGKGKRAGGLEWIGARLAPPLKVEREGGAYRPHALIWLEWPTGVIVGMEVVPPEEGPEALGHLLVRSMDSPHHGEPRRPGRLRVADADTAEGVRKAVGEDIPIRVAPTPEMEAVQRSMNDFMGAGSRAEQEESYLDGEDVSPELIANLFEAAATLFRIQPWLIATDDQVIRMDIPALGVEGACISIIGELGESLGLLVFPSLEGYETFFQLSVEGLDRDNPDFGTSWLALNFERGADLPDTMRREVAAHGWPVVQADAYPEVVRYERDQPRAPVRAIDIHIMTACALALVKFMALHKKIFDLEKLVPITASFTGPGGISTHLTAPYAEILSNDDWMDEAEGPEQEYIVKLIRFARERFGPLWEHLILDFTDAEAYAGLIGPWSLFDVHVKDRPLACWYMETGGAEMTSFETAFTEAQLAAWLSVWEVTDVAPGGWIALRDLLTDKVRAVQDKALAPRVVRRDNLLARVMRFDGAHVFAGRHPHLLPPEPAAEVVRLAKGRLGRVRAVPVDRLRRRGFSTYLLHKWDEHCELFDLMLATEPEPGLPRRATERVAYYEAWPDRPLTALKEKTPREAARRAQGRREVDVLVKALENSELRQEGGPAFDFTQMRRTLKLD